MNLFTIRLIVYELDRYQPDLDLDQGELHTHISIDAFVARSIEMKRELYQKIVTNLEVLGIPKNHVEILLH